MSAKPAVLSRGLCKVFSILGCFGHGTCVTRGIGYPLLLTGGMLWHLERGHCVLHNGHLAPRGVPPVQRLAATTSGVEATAVSGWRGCMWPQ